MKYDDGFQEKMTAGDFFYGITNSFVLIFQMVDELLTGLCLLVAFFFLLIPILGILLYLVYFLITY